jgi:hypothetical protein
VVGDGEKIRTIVDNLVSNAIKYSPRSGTIAIDVGVDGAFAVLDVVDEGPGIEPGERQRIFESFYQGKPPLEGRVKGSGLGLAIAREYALVHGGRIEVSDRDDGRRGARFRLWLPLAATAGVSTEKATHARRPRRSRGRDDLFAPGSAFAVSAILAGCATLTPVVQVDEEVEEEPVIERPPIAPMVEYPRSSPWNRR